MNRILDAISTFNIGSPRHDLPKGSTERPSRNEDPGPVPQSRRTGERFYPPRRQSTFDILRPKSKKGEAITAEKAVDRQKSIRGRREDLRQILIRERAELRERISILNIEVERKSKLLRSMTAKDDAEKWEDELFETRLKELRSARAVINTQSSVTGEDVLHQIKDLNSIIVQTAEIAVETPLQTQGLVVQLEDMKYLGKNLSLIFQQAGNRLDDQGLIRATLQIFLTESCMKLINSWHLENKNLDMALRGLYSHIRGKEEQTVAGKWRQITFGQQPQGTSDNFLSQYSDKKTQQLMQISAAAGWGGDVSKVQPLVRTMMMKAENIRINVKARVISADLQPWIATHCEKFDAQSMQDDGLNVGLKRVGDAKNCHVLGSTELGLRIEGTSDNESGEFRGLQSRPRVLLLESLGFRMQSSTGRH